MIRVADFIAQTLAEHGIRHVFMVTGGGAMHLNDAFGRCRALRVVPCHHEQACAMAAESYFRCSGRLAAVNVTTGPGGTNAITGVWGAWVDSLAMIVISGNVKWSTMARSTGLPLRQLGDQEADIVRIVESFTKYAVVVREPTSIRYHLERALHLSTQGRPGPVWLDIPMDVQGALVDPESLGAYDSREDPAPGRTDLDDVCAEILDRLREAKRPVILASSGIRAAGAYDDFLRLVDALGIPVTTAWNAHDLVWNDHPYFAGRPGTFGDRAGNFAVQNADVLLSLGCRLSIRQVSYEWKLFAREAFKIVVDIDDAELKKPTITPDLPVHADVGDVIRGLLAQSPAFPTSEHREWMTWCKDRVQRYPTVRPEHFSRPSPINPYAFLDRLFHQLEEGEIVVCADGTACVATFHAAWMKRGQRVYHNSGSAPMGYDLPATVGAYLASGAERIICLAGDGSIMMNLHELQTLVTQRVPAKLFVLANGGYHSIRQTQQAHFPDARVGYDPASGVEFPDFQKIADAFGIPYRKIDHLDSMDAAIVEALTSPGIEMCEVALDPTQGFAPKLASRKLPDGKMISSPLEDLAPFLPRSELRANMWVSPPESGTDEERER